MSEGDYFWISRVGGRSDVLLLGDLLGVFRIPFLGSPLVKSRGTRALLDGLAWVWYCTPIIATTSPLSCVVTL